MKYKIALILFVLMGIVGCSNADKEADKVEITRLTNENLALQAEINNLKGQIAEKAEADEYHGSFISVVEFNGSDDGSPRYVYVFRIFQTDECILLYSEDKDIPIADGSYSVKVNNQHITEYQKLSE